jgi:hypothetical protein
MCGVALRAMMHRPSPSTGTYAPGTTAMATTRANLWRSPTPRVVDRERRARASDLRSCLDVVPKNDRYR